MPLSEDPAFTMCSRAKTFCPCCNFASAAVHPPARLAFTPPPHPLHPPHAPPLVRVSAHLAPASQSAASHLPPSPLSPIHPSSLPPGARLRAAFLRHSGPAQGTSDVGDQCGGSIARECECHACRVGDRGGGRGGAAPPPCTLGLSVTAAAAPTAPYPPSCRRMCRASTLYPPSRPNTTTAPPRTVPTLPAPPLAPPTIHGLTCTLPMATPPHALASSHHLPRPRTSYLTTSTSLTSCAATTRIAWARYSGRS